MFPPNFFKTQKAYLGQDVLILTNLLSNNIDIDVDEFKDHADNGDLLLFKSQTFGTKVQRVVTRSEYDHVGMIVL